VALACVLSTTGERKKKTSSSFSPETVSGPVRSWAELVGRRQVSASSFFFCYVFFFFFLFLVLNFNSDFKPVLQVLDLGLFLKFSK
jgi:hypothetical protein